jgi:molybdopterin molybdotransferase
MISVEEAGARILAAFAALAPETVALAAAHGRALAEDLEARVSQPPSAVSAMDGYAVRAADVHGASELSTVTLGLVGTVPMGDIWRGALAAGEAVAISTGGFLPAGADAVVMVEHTSSTGESEGHGRSVEIARAVAPGANVIQPGEDLAAGADVLPAGRRLRPQDLAALATFGFAEVPVFRRPRVAVLSTGNELVEPSARPGPGQVRDANQVALGAQSEAAGCAVRPRTRSRAPWLDTASMLFLSAR